MPTTSEAIELAKLRAFLESGAARAVRVNHGLSLREVGDPVGVSPSTVLRWERRDRTPQGAAALRYWELLQGLMSA